MRLVDIIKKINRRIWGLYINFSKDRSFYYYSYSSFWHSLLFSKQERIPNPDFYFAAYPNYGAGIGHQMANWISGYWWAKQFGVKFAHIPFSSPQWEDLLGFGEDETKAADLLQRGYKKVLLPYFDQRVAIEIERIQSIIRSYQGKRVIFVCEGDQAYTDQYGVILDIQGKFYGAASRRYDQLVYSKDCYNIAIHVRRGDIVIGHENHQNQNLLMRWQNNDYFVNVLSNVLKVIRTERQIAIYLFSQGVESDFDDFKQFSNLHFCLGMNARDSFLHMVYADLLITSKSSFSYKPALLNRGVKICPKNFWHGYPKSSNWILADENGHFELIDLLGKYE